MKIPLFTASFKIHLQFELLVKMILFYSSSSFDEMKNSLFSIKTKIKIIITIKKKLDYRFPDITSPLHPCALQEMALVLV